MLRMMQWMAVERGGGGGARPVPSSGGVHVRSRAGRHGHVEEESGALPEQRRRRAGSEVLVSGLCGEHSVAIYC